MKRDAFDSKENHHMQALNRNLVAFALAAAVASPAAFAQGKSGAAVAPKAHASTTAAPTRSAGAATADSVKTGARPASPTLPTQASQTASDAISARTDAQERGAGAAAVTDTSSTGTATTAAQTTPSPTTPTSPTTTMGSGATGAMADAKSAATTNPGKGNWWTAADTNGDGKLSPTEAAANAGVNARFPSIDLDKDGFVTQDEYRDFFTRNASQGEQHAAAHSMVVTRDVWLKLDADADSKLSVAEATGDVGLSAAFTSVDANKDGFVTQDEYRAYTKANMK
jgi:hypothetical protein